MEHLEIVLIIMAVITVLAPLADRIKLPFPILLVLVGLGIGFIPGLPAVKLDPSVVFLVFLPPLLYEAAVNTSWKDFKGERNSIIFLAGRMVFLTTGVLAVVIHYCIPGFSWPLSFLLGAIISPPDAVAAMAATRGLKLPRRVRTIIEGESLVNDASALIAYRFALAAVAGGAFIYWRAIGQFILVVSGGVAIGIVIGYLFTTLLRRLGGNASVETCLSLLVCYVAYVAGEHFHTSGVLAVVTTGLFISWRSFSIFSYQTRLQMKIFWQILVFLLNGFVFTLIGLQLPSILAGIGRDNLPAMIGYGLLVSGAAIAIRLAILIPASFIQPKTVKLSKEELRKRRKELIVISWSGMRGVVSLATALAIPLTLSSGVSFPHRDAILFITFVVILVTLVAQGLSFPAVVRKLKVFEPEGKSLSEEQQLRKEIADLSLSYLNQTLSVELDKSVLDRLTQEYRLRLRTLNGMLDPDNAPPTEGISEQTMLVQYVNAQLRIAGQQRARVIEMHHQGLFSDELLRRIEQELDIWNVGLNAQSRAVQLGASH